MLTPRASTGISAVLHRTVTFPPYYKSFNILDSRIKVSQANSYCPMHNISQQLNYVPFAKIFRKSSNLSNQTPRAHSFFVVFILVVVIARVGEILKDNIL